MEEEETESQGDIKRKRRIIERDFKRNRKPRRQKAKEKEKRYRKRSGERDVKRKGRRHNEKRFCELFYVYQQGTLTEGEGSVQLTSSLS